MLLRVLAVRFVTAEFAENCTEFTEVSLLNVSALVVKAEISEFRINSLRSLRELLRSLR